MSDPFNRDKDFKKLVDAMRTKHAVKINIERTEYSNHHQFRIEFYSEETRTKIKRHTILLSGDELVEISDKILEALKGKK